MPDALILAGTREVPVFFRAGDEQLFGVLTLPDGAPRGAGVILLVGGSYIPGTNRNRLSVRLAQQLAARGFHVLRFDYHGVGESTGEVSQYDLERPFTADLDGAVDVIRSMGLRRLVLIGSCFGSRTILATADHVPDLAGAVLMATPVGNFLMSDRLSFKAARTKTMAELIRLGLRRKTLRSIFAPLTSESGRRMRNVYTQTVAAKAGMILERLRSRQPVKRSRGYRSPLGENFAAGFRKVVERGVPLLFLYGQDDGFYDEFSQARLGSLRPVFENARAPLDVQTVHGILHGFTTLAVQDAALEQTIAWVERTVQTE